MLDFREFFQSDRKLMDHLCLLVDGPARDLAPTERS